VTGGPPVPFIVGAGRSGNTLLRLMLGAHPDLAIPPETDFIPELATRWSGPDDARAAFVGTVTGHWRFTDLGVDAAELERRVARLEPFSLGAGLRTLYRLYAEKFGKSRFGDRRRSISTTWGWSSACSPRRISST
jgi:Sulfotransferase family